MKKKTKKMNEEKHGDHEPEMIRSQLKTAGRASKRIEKHSRKKDNFKAWYNQRLLRHLITWILLQTILIVRI